jgi:cellobiose phosphorylase
LREETASSSLDALYYIRYIRISQGIKPACHIVSITPHVHWYTSACASSRHLAAITTSGGGYTWSENSRENRLTPWSNDPVGDPPGEVLYLRDQASGALWSAASQPAGGGHMRMQHGFGYSAFTQ